MDKKEFHKWTLQVEEQLHIMKRMIGMMRVGNAIPKLADPQYEKEFNKAYNTLNKLLDRG